MSSMYLHQIDGLSVMCCRSCASRFRHPYKLRDLHVRAKLKETIPPMQTGNCLCNSIQCKTRHMMLIVESFLVTAQVQCTEHGLNSRKTRNLVYLIQCGKCGLQYMYVGETENPLHIRMNGHRSDINTQKTTNP